MKVVEFSTVSCLTCVPGTGEVVVCVSSEIAAHGFVDAIATLNPGDNCDDVNNYSLQYDETDLIDPDYSLVPNDIETVFCKGCLTKWLLGQIPEVTPLAVTDTATINHTINPTVPQTLYSDVNVSADANNGIEIHADGLFMDSAGSGSISRSVQSVASDTNVGATIGTDYVYLVSGTTTMTMPAAAGNTNLYTIKRVGSGIVTIAGAGNFDGSGSIQLLVQYASVNLISDGVNWNVI